MATVSRANSRSIVQARSTRRSPLRPNTSEPLIWETVTFAGLPAAPGAVTRTIPTRSLGVRLAAATTVIVPALLPLPPDWMLSQSVPETTAAVQVMVPAPRFATSKVTVPPVKVTSRFAGVTDKDGPRRTVRMTGRLVFPFPVVVLTKLTVSVYSPAARALAPALRETVTVADSPTARVPDVAERVVHDWSFEAVQARPDSPVFWSV